MEKNTSGAKRSSFTGKIGFVLAAAGSAVGLGNIWRFPYLAAKYGGGMFLLVYVALSVTFGFSLMIVEIAIGRKSGKSAIAAFESFDKRFKFLGILASAVPFLILPYYSVIGGWVLKYFAGFATGYAQDMAGSDYFGSYISTVGEPLLWFAVFIGVTALVVLFGVEKGIEKVSRVLMPMLVFLILGISVYTVAFTEGAWEGVIYYVKPNFSRFSLMTVVAAVGQLFYSMSLAMGVMITFGSYMKKDISIEKSVKHIEVFDTAVAFLSGLMIIPAVFAFSGGDESALGQGPGLMFVTLPKVFEYMPGGEIVGSVFFFMVMLAALTSSVSLMETVVSILMDKLKLSRRQSCFVILVLSALLGIPSSLGYSVWSELRIFGMQILDFFDFFANSIMMPIIAFITCIFAGYIIEQGIIEAEVARGGKFKMKGAYRIIVRYAAPICILAILVSSILGVMGILQI